MCVHEDVGVGVYVCISISMSICILSHLKDIFGIYLYENPKYFGCLAGANVLGCFYELYKIHVCMYVCMSTTHTY